MAIVVVDVVDEGEVIKWNMEEMSNTNCYNAGARPIYLEGG